MRRHSTDAEMLMWSRLRNRQVEGVKFRRQAPIGRYTADFVGASVRLVIEVDGGQHAQSEHDAERTAAIETAGYIVLRFWNNDVLTNIDGVIETIVSAIRVARNN
jgi:very-short-patch-repair endonuclease